MFTTNIIPANSFDIFRAACESIEQGFVNSPADTAEISAEMQRVYETIMDDISPLSLRQDIMANTGGQWQGAVFPVEVVCHNTYCVTVVVGGIAYGGYVVDLSPDQVAQLRCSALANGYV
jgi:hypothetical protein